MDRHEQQYAWEKFYSGMRTLARGDDPPAERLRRAWLHELSHAKPEGIPEEKREAFEELSECLSKGRPPDELQTHALIDEVISIFMALCKQMP
jgi:hypothetical protein